MKVIPSTDHDWSNFVLRVEVSIPEPRDYLLLEEFGPEENIWRGKRLCLSFLVKSSFLLKKCKQGLIICLDGSEHVCQQQVGLQCVWVRGLTVPAATPSLVLFT